MTSVIPRSNGEIKMDRNNIMEALLEKTDGRCAYCGKALKKEDAVIDHIFPKALGGSDHMENLLPACKSCNCAKGDRCYNEAMFSEHLQKMLCEDNRFENIRVNEVIELKNREKTVLDLTFSRNINGRNEVYITEVKNYSSVTNERITSVIRQLNAYREVRPKAHFILAVPMPLAAPYRQRLLEENIILWDAETLRNGIPDTALFISAPTDRYEILIDRLKRCEPGRREWRVYQNLIGEILSVLFCPPLESVSEQNTDSDCRNRRDFIIPNYTDCGYWPYLRNRYHAELIVVDAKNASGYVTKEDILQVAHYLKEKGAGLFALICTRYGVNESAVNHLKDIWQSEDKMIVVLNDNDIEQMLLTGQAGGDPCRLILEKIEEFRLKI